MTEATLPQYDGVENQPLFMDVRFLGQLETISDAVEKAETKLQAAVEEQMAQGASDFWDFADGSFLSRYRPYSVTDGILTVPVYGALRSNFPYQLGAYATGYEYIAEAVARGMGDSNVKGIVLHVRSPGGAVLGMFELVNKITSFRGEKPMRALVDQYAYSAGYCVASCADKIVVGEIAEVGSIGVIMKHTEVSKMRADAGVTDTIVRSKPFKGEGGMFEPLKPETQARMKATVDALHDKFVEAVATNRSMTEKAVDSTDALSFMGFKAVDVNLADEVQAFDAAFSAFVAITVNNDEGDETMADNKQAGTITQEAHDAAVAAAKAAGVTEGKKIGATEERGRIDAIVNSDEAKNRQTAAFSTAMKTELTADAAKSFLATLPEEAAAPAASDPVAEQPQQPGAGAAAGVFQAAMNGTQNPGINGETAEEPTADDKLMANISAMGLPGFAQNKQ
jgi:signal peptide peptidase SppA